MEGEPFSDQLERWLRDDGPKTVGNLGEVFGEKSFAVAVVLLMFVPAIPAPTGGITHVFEVITVIIGAEMVIGARTIWLPARWRDRELGETATKKAIPFIARTIRWFERFSRPRLAGLYEQGWFVRILGVFVIALAVSAAFAPPFSGLDTLPALGAVIVALSIILRDALVLGIGVTIGTGGVILIVTLGAAVILMSRPNPMTASRLAALGVRRISVGSALARVAWGGFIRAAKTLAEGSFDGFAGAATIKELDQVFER